MNEGPVALQRNGRTFITYSASACQGPDYKLGHAHLHRRQRRCSAGSWVKKSTPIFQRNDAARRLRARPQRVLQVAGRHRGLDRLPRQHVRHRTAAATPGRPASRGSAGTPTARPNFGVPVSTSTVARPRRPASRRRPPTASPTATAARCRRAAAQHRRRRPDRSVGLERQRLAAVAVRGRRRRLLPHPEPAQRQVPGRDRRSRPRTGRASSSTPAAPAPTSSSSGSPPAATSTSARATAASASTSSELHGRRRLPGTAHLRSGQQLPMVTDVGVGLVNRARDELRL